MGSSSLGVLGKLSSMVNPIKLKGITNYGCMGLGHLTGTQIRDNPSNILQKRTSLTYRSKEEENWENSTWKAWITEMGFFQAKQKED